MSQKDQLLSRLYAKPVASKAPKGLIPKNPDQISPTLKTSRLENKTDTVVVPGLRIPEDINSRTTGGLPTGTSRPATATGYRAPPTPLTANSTMSRPPTALNSVRFGNTPRTPKTNEAITPSLALSGVSIPHETPVQIPTSRARPRSYISNDVRPSTALDRSDSKYSRSNVTSKAASARRPESSFATSSPISARREKPEFTIPKTATPQAEEPEVPYTLFRLKKSNNVAQIPDDLERFKMDEFYTSAISDDLWNDQRYIFYYIRLIKQKKLDEEFLYFHSTPPTAIEPENVYFLRVTSPNVVNWQNYYTLSADGVTSYKGGKVEFTKLAQWVRECTIFIQIKNQKFFHQYEKWRSFTLLRTITLKHGITHSQTKMSSELFIVDAILRHAVLDLQKVCNQVLYQSLVDVKSSQSLTLQQFVDRQNEHLEKVRVIVTDLIESARTSIVHACDVTYEATGSSHDSLKKKQKKKEKKEDDTEEVKPKKVSAQAKKEKPTRSSDMMVYTQLATQRFCYKRLSRFIRLCDYMLIHCLYSFVIKSITELVDFLAPRANSQGGDITRLSINMIIEDQKLAFSPNLETTRSQIIEVWELLLQFAFSIPTFSEHASLSQYYAAYGWSEYVVPLSKIMHNSLEYRELSTEMITRIENAYSLATKKIEDYVPFLTAYFENVEFNVDKVRAEDPKADYYNEKIELYRKEIKEMDALERNTQVDLLLVILSQFCDRIKPSPRRCLQALNAAIPVIAETKVTALQETVDESLRTLRNDPQTIHVFVSQLEFRRQTSKNMETIRQTYKEISDFYALIQNQSITVADDQVLNWRQLGQFIQQLETLLQSMNEEEDNKIKKWSPSIAQLLSDLSKEFVEMHSSLQNEKVMSVDAYPQDNIQYLSKLQTKLDELRDRSEEIQRYQRSLQIKVSPIDELTQITQEFNVRMLLWTSYRDWQILTKKWLPSPFKTIDVENMTEELQKYTRISMQITSGMPNHPLGPTFKASVNSFNEILPVIVAFTNPNLTPMHWQKIESLTGIQRLNEATYSLNFLIDKHISSFSESIESIANDATNEAALLKALREIEATWDKVEFTMVPHKDIKDFYLVGSLDEVIALLEESQVQLSTIRSSRYVGAIKSQVDDYSKAMNGLAKCLDYITQFQIAFNSLSKVFSSSDIQRELATETKELSTIERQYKAWGLHARDSPRVYKLCANQKAVSVFEGYIQKTDEIQKALEAFLQKKRTAFPRFYFLSNENLLKIFAEARNPKAVQPFLQKLFEGIQTLRFSANCQDILSMTSAEGEVVTLTKTQTLGAIEGWMSNMEKSMKLSINRVLKNGRNTYVDEQRTAWLQQNPAQVVSVITQINFAMQVEEALSQEDPIKALNELREKQEKQLVDLADLVRTKLSRAIHSSIVALITLDVHSRDIVTELIDAEVKSVDDFEWTRRLRYYWDEDSNRVQIHQANANIEYGYEYLGATSRLVVTPLTERCYLTLTSAAQFFLGGSPAGPAGTGKTETVKDLAKAVGNFCVVFNCSDAVTVIQMESFFSGLAQSGAWACFDEFNRINSEVLSVIAEQVYEVQSAAAAGLTQFTFCGQTIPLNPRAGVFITMNPGYAGRTELPDNLKSLFRPISMMVPDYSMIAEVVLYSEGFNNAKQLAQKVTQLYKLSSEMLSRQSHYDFGMRALKSVLVMAGASKRRSPDLNEDIILIRSMRDSNISKLLIDDCKLFDAIIGDLFPGVEFQDEVFPTLEQAIANVYTQKKLQPSQFLTTKTIQLYQTIFIRHGVMLVGPTGGGKTTSRNILADALGLMGSQVEFKELSPKSVTLTDLYGAYNLVTGDWKNGLVGKMFSEMAEADPKLQEWIIFDGPVDALWIENMNTVLDDNKLLSLANSDRIKMTDQMHLLFEVGDLEQASPATVSRCGMVYYQPEDLGWHPLVDAWILKQPENIRPVYTELFEKAFDPAMNCLQENCKTVIKPVIWNIAQSICSIIDAMVHDQTVDWNFYKEDVIAKAVSHIFAFAAAWAFGGIITDGTRGDFDTFMRDIFERRINYPTRHMIFDYYLDMKELKFIPWTDLLAKEEVTSIIPTSDTLRFSSILSMLINMKRPVLFLGESGCGKTSIIQNTLQKNMNSIYAITFTLSARTTAAQLQDLLEAKLQSKRKTLYGPPEGKSAVLLIDDFNLPRPDTYWSQPPIEILRQVINCKGLYNRDELYWYDIDNLTTVAAGITQGHVTPRFISRFTVLSLPAPSDNVLTRIFGETLNRFLANGFMDPVVGLAESIVKASVTFYRKAKAELLPTPSRSHYTFNLRDVSRVFKGICMTSNKSLADVPTFVKLWFHECMRVFGDRLIDNNDREKLQQMMYEISKSTLKVKEDISYFFGETPLVFTDILKGYGDPNKRIYEESASLTKTSAALQTFAEIYKSPIVLFKECIEHILRIVRVLRQPVGHMLLVGMGGTGKRTAARFAAFVAEIEIFGPQPGKEYGLPEFRNDLRGLFKTAGVANKPIMFLLTDEQIVDESFLEDINNILNSGEVPGLFESEEFDQMVNELVPQMKKAGESLGYDSLCRRFTQNIMNNLHVVLALSPIGGSFRDRCRIFPSLVSCCTIDWYDPWPDQALRTVAADFIDKIDLSEFGDVKEKIADLATTAHSIVCQAANQFKSTLNRVYYVTPAVYVEFFALFNATLAKRKGDLNQKKEQLEKGVEKLLETNEKVQEMEGRLTTMRPQLQVKAENTAKILAKLKVDREHVNQTHLLISKEEEVVKKVREEATQLADEAQADLDRALPYLENAKAAVEDLKNKKTDLAAVKTFVKPPQLVIEIMEAVCLLCGKNPDWASAKQLLSQTDFFNRLLEIHNNPIHDSVLDRIRKMSADPRFELSKVMGVSQSAACLFKWVTAIEQFVTENTKIQPKIKRRDEAKAKQEEAEINLKKKQEELVEISEKLAQLQQEYDNSVNEQKELQVKIEQCEYRLKNASQLTTALDSERVRWSENLKELREQEKSLLGDSLLISLHVAYVGPFSMPFRQTVISQWIKKFDELEVIHTQNFALESVAVDPITLREWQVNGLPNDQLSRQNGVLVTSTRRWPLLIDPQGQGRSWLLANSGIKAVRCDDPNYTREIISAIKLGTSILVEDVGEVLDPGLQFILLPKFKVASGRKTLKVGDKWIDYDPQFRLYLTTKLSNPQYLPDVFIQLSVINFSVTLEGLEEQLLSDVVLHEMPELEKQRSDLIVAISKDQKQLSQLMSQILHLLFTSKGNILDNEQLIKTLNEAKSTATQVGERLIESQKTEKEIAEKREVYRPVATRGSVLYFVVLELPGIDTMYQYSLEFFKRIFNAVLDNTEDNDNVEEKCDAFIERTTYAVYANVSRGLFSNHRQVFAFLIATWLHRSTNQIQDDMWKIFTRGPPDVDLEKFGEPNDKIEPRIWSKACALSAAVPEFRDLPSLLCSSYEDFQPFIFGPIFTLPAPFDKLPTFMKLICATCIARRKVVSISRQLVAEILGAKFVESSSVDLNEAFADTSNDTPLLFILSQGADPRETLERLASEHGVSSKLHILSLGQGRGPTASKLVKDSKRDGDWVFLQNCHLCPSFLPKLEHIVQKMSATSSTFHSEFRLFLSSMPTEVFPISILRNSVKVTSEPPSGIKPNIGLLMNTLSSEKWEGCPKSRPWKKLVYSIAVFHATIQERKRYGSLGFNKTYEWNTSDFSIATKFLLQFLTQQDQVPWQALKTMIGGVVYGGRVTDDWDRRCMNAILDKFLDPNALEDNFYFDSDNLYSSIPLCDFTGVFDHISNLPNDDSPSIFGLHPTALNALNLRMSEQMMTWVLNVQPRDAGGESASKDDEMVVALAEQLDTSLISEINLKGASPSIVGEEGSEETDQPPNSMTVVLFQEMERYNKLIKVIHSTLKECCAAVRGEVVMSVDSQDVYRSLISQRVPEAWSRHSYPSMRPLSSWFKDLLQRVDFIRDWIRRGEPTVFWFPGFFFPQSFLTAVLQSHSRKHKLPIDKLSFKCEVLKESPEKIVHQPEDGAYISGLFIDGGRWDSKNFVLCDNDTDVVYNEFPCVHIIPVADFESPEADYKCPLYRTPERAGVLSTTGHSTNFVVALNLPTNSKPDKWTLRGTALLLTTPY